MAFDHLENPQQRAFLAAYSEVGTVKRAAKIAGIARETHYEWKRSSKEYARAFLKEARHRAGGALEDEAVRRARYGERDYVLYQGVVVEYQGKPLTKRRYSDHLLLALLKSHLPKQYADRKEIRKEIEHKGTVKHQHGLDYTSFSDEDLTILERFAEKAARPRRDPRGAGTPEASKD